MNVLNQLYIEIDFYTINCFTSMIKSIDFSTQEYWDKKYAEKDTQFEWLRPYSEIKEYVNEHIKKNDKILIPGCGNSSLGPDMYNDGYKNLVNNDFSPVVIEQMSKRYSEMKTLVWDVMDITKMTYANESFDTVLDKGTIDALTCGEDYENQIFKACCEYSRVLKPGGFAYILSFGQPEDRLCYFDPKTDHPWTFEGYDPLPFEKAPGQYYIFYKIRKN